ncbi:MAG: hypothetical protein ACI4V5_00255 [Prevotella sp.]
MRFNNKITSKYPLSCLCIIAIWILCFCTPPHTPLDNVALADKWTHIIMYGGTCSIIWFEYLKSHNSINIRSAFILIWLTPVAMSGLIELLQAYCTDGRRSGDWIDFAANIIGATIAFGIGFCVAKTRKNDNQQGDH